MTGSRRPADPRFSPATSAADLPVLVAARRDEARLTARTAAVERAWRRAESDADEVFGALGLADCDGPVIETTAEPVDARGREPAARTLVRRLDGTDRWGVLTDGRRWRLYGGGDADEERYLELDLRTVLADSERGPVGGDGADEDVIGDDGDANPADPLVRFVALFAREAFEGGANAEDGEPARFLDALSEADAARRAAVRDSLCDRFVAAVETLRDAGDARPEAATALGFRLVFDLFVADRTESSAFVDDADAFDAVRRRLAARAAASDQGRLAAADGDLLRAWVAGAAESPLGGAFTVDSSPEATSDAERALADAVAADDSALERVCALLSTAAVDGGIRVVDYRAVDARHLADLHERLVDAGFDGAAGPATRRKGDGSFYTPEPVVTYLAERTAGALVADARGASDAASDPTAEVRSRVLERRVLDPAMGGGALLLAVARRLAVGVRRAARGADDPVESFASIRRRVVARCLYGVERDPAAAAVARLACLAEALGPETDVDALPELSDRSAAHLRCGDALLGPYSDSEGGARGADGGSEGRTEPRPIRWNFGRSNASGDENSGRGGVGVDAVVGNPPWKGTAGRADISARLDGATSAYLREAFESTAGPQPNLYAAFLERACRLAPGGYVAFVVPDAILVRLTVEPARRFLLGDGGLTRALRVGNVFPDANEGAAIVVCEPGSDAAARGDVLAWFGDAEAFAAAVSGTRSVPARPEIAPRLPNVDADAFEYRRLRRDAIASEPYARLQLLRDETADGIFRKLERLDPFEAVGSVARGEEFGKRDARVRAAPTAGTRRLVPGSAVRPHTLCPREVRHVDAGAVTKDVYDPPKLLCRQTGRYLVATSDTEGVANLKSVYDAHVEGDDEELLLHLSGLLNSTVYNYYHYVRRNAYPARFPQNNQRNYETLPVWGGAVDAELVSLVERRRAVGRERASLETAVDAVVDFGAASVPLDRFDPTTADDGFAGSHRGEVPGLRIAGLSVRTEGRALTLRAAYEADGVSEARPALRFEGVTPRDAAVLSTWLPAVGDAPVVRRRACGLRPVGRSSRTTPAARLRALRVPDPATHAGSLARCARDRRRAAVLDDRAAALDDRIDARVAELVGLTDAELAHVRETMADAPGWASVRRPRE